MGCPASRQRRHVGTRTSPLTRRYKRMSDPCGEASPVPACDRCMAVRCVMWRLLIAADRTNRGSVSGGPSGHECLASDARRRTARKWYSAGHRDAGLTAIIAIRSTTLGPALGGTRMYPQFSSLLTRHLRAPRASRPAPSGMIEWVANKEARPNKERSAAEPSCSGAQSHHVETY